jgi:two-component system cell cycle sensor histidine kinase/response regulator CckA
MAAKRILIVQGEPDRARELERALTRFGYQVVGTASTGEQALRRTAEERPDLVLMAMRLKGDVDGIETAQRVEGQYGAPVVHIASSGDKSVLQRAASMHAYGYLVEPIGEAELRSAVEVALYRHQIERDLVSSRQEIASILAAAFDGIIVTDRDGLITAINTAAAALTEWPCEDAIGKDWAEVFKTTEPLPSDLAALGEDVRYFDERSDGVAFAVLLSLSGRRVPMEHRSAPITDAHGDVEGTVLTFRELRPSAV